MNLSDIFCQDKAVDGLARAYANNRLAGTYIFAGPDGIGKRTVAQAFAKLLLCSEPINKNGFFDSCGNCRSCTLFEAQSHPDFGHIYKELTRFSNNPSLRNRKSPTQFPIDVVREFLIDRAASRPGLSEKKVYVLHEAEKLNKSSQNALLKVLEEPPGFCHIILLCTRMDKLLPTTRSRSRVVRFGPVSAEKIVSALEPMGIDSSQSLFFSRFTGGSIGQSLQLCQLRDEEYSFYDFKTQLIERLAEFTLADAVELCEWVIAGAKRMADIVQKGDSKANTSDLKRSCQKSAVNVIMSFFADAMKAGFTGPDDFVNFDQPDQVHTAAERFGPDKCGRMVSTCSETIKWIESSVNEKLAFEHLLLNLGSSDKMVI